MTLFMILLDYRCRENVTEGAASFRIGECGRGYPARTSSSRWTGQLGRDARTEAHCGATKEGLAGKPAGTERECGAYPTIGGLGE